MFCRSVKPQSIEKMKIFFKPSGWVQKQLRKTVGGAERRELWSLSEATELQALACPSCALPQSLPQHFGNNGLIVPLQESSECWYHFSALR